MNKVIIVIPARYGSTRFPGKPLQLINGKPMIYWTYQQALKVKNADSVIVATENKLIVDKCKDYDIPVVLTSDKHQTGTDRIAEVALTFDADIYVNIQGDEPLIEPNVVEELIKFMKENTDYICSTIKSKIDNPIDAINNTVSKVVTDLQDNIMYISRQPMPYPRSSLDFVYYKALGIYAFRKSALEIYRNNSKGPCELAEDIELLRLVERGVKIHDLLVESNSPSVDTPKDLLRVENILKKIKEY